jgi:hypothetical protein
MRQSWKALGVALLALGLEAGCNDYNTSIQYPTGASIVTLAPSGVVFGSAGFTLTVIGTSSNGFQTNTVVEWNGQKLVSTYIDTVTITATIPANLVAKVGTAYVNTYTPQSGTGMNGLSNSIAFLIYGTPNPVPVVMSVTPNTAAACGSSCGHASVKITIAGSDFLSTSTNGASTVTFTGVSTGEVETAINVTNITPTQIQAVIPGTMLADADPNALINVINPPSGVCLVGCPVLGGGPSLTPQTFTITGGGAAVAEETPALSQDGRYVAFSAQENETTQIMLRDTCLGVQNGCTPSTKLISVAADSTPGNADSHTPVISADGRYIAFSSAATNLLEGAPSGRQVYLRDTCAGASGSCKTATSLVSTDPGGALNGTESIFPSISSSGRYIVFLAVTPGQDTAKGKLPAAAAASPNSGLRQVFLRDTCLGATNCTPKTTRISLSPGDTPANSNKPVGPALSGLAKQVALADRKSATVFTPTVPVDDQVFLAEPQEPKQ